MYHADMTTFPPDHGEAAPGSARGGSARGQHAAAFDLGRHPYFEAWTDPGSGVVSYLLRERVAPVQQSFYFTNPSVCPDERWLWLYCAFPPNPVRTLAVVSLDPDRPLMRHFPAAGFDAASPMVAPGGETPGCYFTQGRHVYFQPVEGGEPRIICSLNERYIAGRRLARLATHLTVSADGHHFLLDGEVGNHWFVGIGDRRTGEVTIIKEFANNHNHAQFAPHDPGLFPIAHDHTHDPITGRRLHFDIRLWLMDTADTRYEPLTPHHYCKPYTGLAHEWWLPDGRIAYVDYQRGVYTVDPASCQHTHIWPRPLCHAHCNGEMTLYCADESPYKWAEKPCEVLLFEPATGRQWQLVSAMPPPAIERGTYHIDPHPQFSPGGTWVTYTTTMGDGTADVALCPVDAARYQPPVSP